MTKTAEDLLFEAQAIIAAHFDSNGAITAEACIAQLLEVVESPEAIVLAVNAGHVGPVNDAVETAALTDVGASTVAGGSAE